MKRNLLILSLIFLVSAFNYSLSNTIKTTSISEKITKNEEGEKEKDPEDEKKKEKKKDPRLSGRIVGLKIGGGPTSVTDFNSFQKNKGGFYVGLSREFLFGKYIGLSVEGNYWLSGYTNDTSLAKISFNYISVPVMVNLNLKGFYIAAGMYAALNLRSSVELGNNKTYYGFQNNLFQQFDWGAVFNVGFKWRFLGFDLRYVLGLQDVLKFTPEKWRNSALFFGVSLHLMKRVKKKD